MTWWGWGLLTLGLMVIGMGLLDRRWGNKGWQLRFLTGLAVAKTAASNTRPRLHPKRSEGSP